MKLSYKALVLTILMSLAPTVHPNPSGLQTSYYSADDADYDPMDIPNSKFSDDDINDVNDVEEEEQNTPVSWETFCQKIKRRLMLIAVSSALCIGLYLKTTGNAS